jgi:hypothetical protein
VLDELDAGNIFSKETYSVSMYKQFLLSSFYKFRKINMEGMETGAA